MEKIDRLIQVVEGFATNRQFVSRLALMAQRIIYERTKRGYGVTDDTAEAPRQVRLKPLSPAYIQRRQRTKLGEFGSPGRSNLTLKGYLLSSMQIRFNRRGFRIYINSKQRPDGHTNDEIAEFVRKERPWFALTDEELRILEDEAQRALVAMVARALR